MAELGGPDVHATNGVCQLVAADVHEAAELTRELLGFLPGRIGEALRSSCRRRRAAETPAPPFPPTRGGSTTSAT